MSIERQEQTAHMVENIQMQFIAAIKSQEQLNHQLNRRNSQIIRYGVFISLIFFAVVIFLSWSQQHNMKRMSDYIAEMTKSVSSMNNAIGQMQNNMNSMKEGINKVVSHTRIISRSIVQPDNSVAVLSHIANSVKLLQDDAHGFNNSIESINYNLTNINKQMKQLNRKLGVMGQDINRMPSPGKMFPF